MHELQEEYLVVTQYDVKSYGVTLIPLDNYTLIISNAATLGGKSLVTFEELYDMTNPNEPKKVTEHKDITDDGQTVTIKEVPEVPDTPKDTDTPDTPSTVTKTSDSPKTGDNTNIYAYLAMLGLSCVGLGGMLYFKRRRKKS